MGSVVMQCYNQNFRIEKTPIQQTTNSKFFPRVDNTHLGKF